MTGLKIHPHTDPLPSRERERIGKSRERERKRVEGGGKNT